jgi:hypothetical protein
MGNSTVNSTAAFADEASNSPDQKGLEVWRSPNFDRFG